MKRKRTELQGRKQNRTMEKEKDAMSHIFSSYASRTTMHGMGTLAAAQSLKAKLFWSCVCAGSMGMFVFMLSRLVIQYLSYPFNVKVEEVRFVSIYFNAHLIPS